MEKNSACVDQTCSSSMQSELGADSSKREARRDGRRDGGNKWSVALVRQQWHIVSTGHYLRCMLPAIGGSRTDRVWTTDIRSGCGQPDRHGSSRVKPVAKQKKACTAPAPMLVRGVLLSCAVELQPIESPYFNTAILTAVVKLYSCMFYLNSW